MEKNEDASEGVLGAVYLLPAHAHSFYVFSDGFSRSEYTEYHYNITLFKEIKRFYTYRELLGMKAFLINTVGNVVCFMPFGFILPIITELGKRWYNTFLLSFLMTLTIETIQLVLKVGASMWTTCF